MHLVRFIIRNYNDTRPPERKILIHEGDCDCDCDVTTVQNVGTDCSEPPVKFELNHGNAYTTDFISVSFNKL